MRAPLFSTSLPLCNAGKRLYLLDHIFHMWLGGCGRTKRRPHPRAENLLKSATEELGLSACVHDECIPVHSGHNYLSVTFAILSVVDEYGEHNNVIDCKNAAQNDSVRH